MTQRLWDEELDWVIPMAFDWSGRRRDGLLD
jgi:hypothetical protein